jgi:hypothetical protein
MAGLLTAPALSQTQPVTSANPSPAAAATNYAMRVKIFIKEVRDLTFDAIVHSATVVDPACLSTSLLGERVVRLSGLDFGETIVIVNTDKGRQTIIVEVVGHPIPTAAESIIQASNKSQAVNAPAAGLYSILFSPPHGGARAFVSQTLQYRRGLSNDRILTFHGDLFSFLGKRTNELFPDAETGFGINRLSLGVVNKHESVDLLDSELYLSPLSLNGYTIRGFHLTSQSDSMFRGAEIFAGLARPSISLLDSAGGRVMGGMYPLKNSKQLTIRAGGMMVTPSEQNHSMSGGLSSLFTVAYTPDEDTTAEGEVAYSQRAVSWRGRFAIQRGPINFLTEVSDLNGQSPFISIGGQGGGRSTLAAAIRWQTSERLITYASYNQTKGAQTFNLSRLSFSGSTLTGGLNYRAGKRAQFGLRYTRQRINSTSRFALSSQLETNSLVGTSNFDFAHNWNNSLEIRYNTTHEPVAGAKMDSGFGLRNEVRHNAEWWSGAAYFNYQNSALSLSSLVLRNPSLLPPLVRQAFEDDPQRFLALNRDLLQRILGDIELPQTRSTEVGVRFQAKLSRYTATGEVRFDDSKLGAQSPQNIVGSITLAMRLDSVNTIGLTTNLQRALRGDGLTGTQNGFSSLTVSYTRRLGGPSEKNFLMKLLGRDHGTVRGRVFADLNADGEDNPDEPGIPGIKVELEDGRSVETEQNGSFKFDRVKLGTVTVRLASDDLGKSLRASTAGQQAITVSPRQTAKVSFGVVDFGSISGRVFNELQGIDTGDSGNKPGINGVRLKLISHHQGTPSATRVTDAAGMYEFRNLTPGKYSVEVDTETLPPYFRMPAHTSWEISVLPVRGSYLDIPLFAQRRVSGVVFLDKDMDGKFDPAVDEVVPNATVISGNVKAVTGPDGSYLLRGLPAGMIEVTATTQEGRTSPPAKLELPPEALIKSGVNLAIPN